MYMYLSIYIYIQNCKAMWQLLWQLMHLCNCYKLLVPMNKSVQQAKQGVEYKWSYVIHNTQSAQISQKHYM